MNNQDHQGHQAHQVEEPEEAEEQPWIARPPTYIDPFRRTTGGFALYGRRRSVCVMTTVPEKLNE